MKYDAIIIGAGPGGYELAAILVRRGEKVLIVERDLPGGTCLNRGCIPTKILCASGNASWADSTARFADVIPVLRSGIESLVKGADYITGEATYLGDKTIRVNDETFEGEKIFIATGSEPASLNIPGKELALDSTQFLFLEELPESVVIIGGGVIGVEFASILLDKGVDVTILEYAPELLPMADKEVAKRMRASLKRRGATILTDVAATAIRPDFAVDYQGPKKAGTIEAKAVLMAIGRKAVVPRGFTEHGLKLLSHGPIGVNTATFATNLPDVYAIGDCNGVCQLAHAASAQARVAAGENVRCDVVPSVVFTKPPCAWVGVTEDVLKDEGRAYKSGKAMYAGNGKAMADDHTEGFVKVLADPATDRILGVHILGEGADTLIGEATMAIACDLTLRDISQRIIHPHPTLCELLPVACENAR